MNYLTPEQQAAFASARKSVASAKRAEELANITGEMLERGDEKELSDKLVGDLTGVHETVSEDDEVWRCRTGLWEEVPHNELVRAVCEYAGAPIKAKTPSGDPTFRPLQMSNARAQGTIVLAKAHLDRRKFFSGAAEGLPLRSSFVVVTASSIEMMPHKAELRIKRSAVSTYDLPDGWHEVPPEYPANWEYLLRCTWFGYDDVQERIDYLYEWIGAALCGTAHRYKDSPLLVGEKDTGKSQILNGIKALFPDGAVSSIGLHQMDKEYYRARLAGARLNAVSELSALELVAGEDAKAILSGDTVNARNPHGRVFELTSKCAHVYAANDLPVTRDRALMERFVVLKCPNKRPVELQDRELGNRIATEAPAIAAHALLAYQRLLQRGHIVRPSSTIAQMSEWQSSSDPVRQWLDDCTEEADESVSAAEAYPQFAEWSQRNGFARMNSNTFGKRMHLHGLHAYRANGKRYRLRILTNSERTARNVWSAGSNHD